MKWRALLLFLTGLSLSLAPAQAQWTGTRLGPDPASAPDTNKGDRAKARLTMHAFVKCVMDVSKTRVLEYLDTIPETPEAIKLADKLARSDCLAEEQLRFRESLFRWTAYDILYNDTTRGADPALAATAPPTDFPAIAAGLNDRQKQVIALRELGECTVRQAPIEVGKVVRSQIASKAESEAITAIVPHIGTCLDQNLKITFSKEVLRGVLAEALYRMTLAANQALASKGGE